MKTNARKLTEKVETSRTCDSPASKDDALVKRSFFTNCKRIIFYIVWLAVLFEGACYIVTHLVAALAARPTSVIFQEQSWHIKRFLSDNSLTQYDPQLGWRYRSNFVDKMNQMNSQGLRSTREYTLQPNIGIIRVAAFGDSFVYGNEVANENCWPTVLEKEFPAVEVLNYGVGAYGTDQAYLRYLSEGSDLSPQIVIIGFTTVNLQRILNVYRRFISDQEFPGVKPRYELSDKEELRLLPNPIVSLSGFERYLQSPRAVTELGEHDYWYQPLVYENPCYDYSASVRFLTQFTIKLANRYFNEDRLCRGSLINWDSNCKFNTSSTAFKIQIKIIERFASDVRARGAIPVVALFPDKLSIHRVHKNGTSIYYPLADWLKENRIDYVDLISAFSEGDVEGSLDKWFMGGGHYSPLGNKIVAQALGMEILARTDSNTAVGGRQ